MNAKIPTLLALSASLVLAQEKKPVDRAEILVELTEIPTSQDLISPGLGELPDSPDWSEPNRIISAVNIQGQNVEFLFQSIEGEIPRTLNFVFNNGAENLAIPKLKLRNVTLDALIGVLRATLGISVEEIPSGEGTIYVLTGPNQKGAMPGGLEGMSRFEVGGNLGRGAGFVTPDLPKPPEPPRAPDAPAFSAQPTHNEGPSSGYLQNNSSRATPAEPLDSRPSLTAGAAGELTEIVRRRTNDRKGPSGSVFGFGAGGNAISARTFVVPGPEGHQTEIFGISELGLENSDIVNAIKEVWDLSESGWEEGENPARILIHPETKLLVVKASKQRIEEVANILATVQGMHSTAQRSEMAEMKQLQDRQLREFEMKFNQVEQMHQLRIERLQAEIEKLTPKVRVQTHFVEVDQNGAVAEPFEVRATPGEEVPKEKQDRE